jgi:hypothetical protein
MLIFGMRCAGPFEPAAGVLLRRRRDLADVEIAGRPARLDAYLVPADQAAEAGLPSAVHRRDGWRPRAEPVREAVQDAEKARGRGPSLLHRMASGC